MIYFYILPLTELSLSEAKRAVFGSLFLQCCQNLGDYHYFVKTNYCMLSSLLKIVYESFFKNICYFVIFYNIFVGILKHSGKNQAFRLNHFFYESFCNSLENSA